MSEVCIRWVDGVQFIGVDSTDHGIVIAGPVEGGKIGTKPSDLLLLSLGSCTAHDVVSILRKKRQNLESLQVHVTGEQDSEPPWCFQRFHVHFVVMGKDLSEQAVADAIRLSDEKYCSVAATLRRGADITHSYEIVQAVAV